MEGEGRAECKIADVNEALKGSEREKEGGREGGGPMCVARRSQVWHGREGMGRAERESGTRNGNVDASIRPDHSWCRKKRTSDTRAHASGLATNSRKCKCNIL